MSASDRECDRDRASDHYRDRDRDRDQRYTRELQDAACNELPAQREERYTRRKHGEACNESSAREVSGRAVARIATAQKGPINVQQLGGVGLGHSAVDRRKEAGALHRIYRGVYLVGHEALAPFARETAALLACGEGSFISHSSAALLWSLTTPNDDDVHVTVVGRRCRSREGLRAHYAAQLDPQDIRRVAGLPVTSPARTFLDLAASKWPDLERAFAEAHVQRLLSVGELERAIRRAGRRPGVGVLRALISDNASGFTRSRAERLLRKIIRAARLPEPMFNARFDRYELDAVWAEQRLVVEVDGYGPHGHRAAFERDRRKDMALAAAGYLVIRVTWRQLNEEPLAVAAAIASALGPRRRPG
jgi:very-short-patch-repair endonuclease